MLTGNDTLSGQVKFEIFNPMGESIYAVEFESRALLDYGLKPGSSKKEMTKYIIERMDSFTSEKNFTRPTIADNEIYDADYFGLLGEKAWHELKRNKESIGFYYLLWEGDQSWIVFIRKEKKVVKYKTCC